MKVSMKFLLHDYSHILNSFLSFYSIRPFLIPLASLIHLKSYFFFSIMFPFSFPLLILTMSSSGISSAVCFQHPSKVLSGKGNVTPLQYSCLENPIDGGAWQAAVHGVAKSRTQLSDFIFTFHFHALEKEMATHSSVLAWRIPGRRSLVGCSPWGHTETTEATQQQQQQQSPVSWR